MTERARRGGGVDPGRLATAGLGLALGLVAVPAASSAQAVAVDASVLGLGASYAAPAGPVRIGVGVGLALPRATVTLSPADDEADFGEYAHLAAFVRVHPAPAWNVDLGLRLGAADLWACPASDCLPVEFAGAYVQPMVRLGSVQLGPRLVAARVGEDRSDNAGSTFAVALEPLLVRYVF